MTWALLGELWAKYADLLALLSVGSIVMLVGSVLLVPWLLLRAPADVFVRESVRIRYRDAGALVLFVIRNILGSLLLLAGLLMLLLPGQGLLTIACAVCLMDIPKKRLLLRRIVTHPPVWNGLAWVRERAGKAPFERP